MKAISIRKAESRDEGAVIGIMNEAIREHRNAYLEELNENKEGSAWFQRLHENALSLFVVEEQGRAIAWCSLTPYRGDRGALSSSSEITFYVSAPYRGKGIASALIKHMEKEAEQMGKQHLFAILLDNNRPSRALLAKMGYEEWANFERIVHHHAGDLGHLYMGKHI